MRPIYRLRLHYLLLVTALTSQPASAQYGYRWEKVDTLTGGLFEDRNPSVFHGFFPGWYGQTQWMVFDRYSSSEATIAAKRYSESTRTWDSDVVVVARRPVDDDHGLPDYSSLSYSLPGDSVTRTVHVIAWHQKNGQSRDIYCSFLRDRDAIWSDPVAITDDSVDNTNARIIPLRDSTFILTWKRKNVVAYSFLTVHTSTSPETLATGSDDSLEYDISGMWQRGDVTWTSKDSLGKRLILHRKFSAGYSFILSPPETLSFGSDAFHPRMTSGRPIVLFEANANGSADIFAWARDAIGQYIDPVSADPSSEDRNASAFYNPIITKPARVFAAAALGFDLLVFERRSPQDSGLVFSHFGFSRDTVRSPGYNRNACVGSRLFGGWGNGTYIPVVWESNRDGRSHIYGRIVNIPYGSVEQEPILPASFELVQNWPNPFNPRTRLRFVLSSSASISLKVFDILGREVATLVEGITAPGTHEVLFDGTRLSTGPYLCRLTVEGNSKTRTMMLLK
jgi:hypothetical protein